MTPMELDYARWIKKRGGRFRLRDLAATRFVYEYRKFHTHMRNEGWVADCKLGKVAGSNLYTIIPPNDDWSIIPAQEKRGPGRPTNEEVRRRTEPTFAFMTEAQNG